MNNSRYGKKARSFFTILKAMKPVDQISKGTIIQMVQSGNEYIVDNITPTGIVLKKCTTFVSFSRAALNERLKRKRAIIVQY